MGVWECDLASETLSWSDGVYDLFDLPRGMPVTRAMTRALYEEESCHAMERLRAKAIEERAGFSLDIRNTSACGTRRWIRLTADVKCESGVPARIFGLKQDVTRERELLDRLQRLADQDPLTGLYNRSLFEARLARAEAGDPDGPALAAILMLDVDRFKLVNDTFGHGAGDDCLKQVADTLDKFASGSLAARIGGDELAVLLYGPWTWPSLDRRLRDLLVLNRRSIGPDNRALGVSVSIGVALAGDHCGPGWSSDLARQADLAVYAAKAAGRDTYRVSDHPPGHGSGADEPRGAVA